MAAERERHLEALRPSSAALVVEPRRRRTGVRLERHIRQRVTPPEAERQVETLQRPLELLSGNSRARGAEKLGEACRVQLASVPLDRVPRRTSGYQRRVAELAPKTRHILVHHVTRTRRRPLAPHRVDQRLDRHDLADLQQQGADHCSFAAARQVHTATVDQRLERPENPKGDPRRRTTHDLTAAPRLPAAAARSRINALRPCN